MLLLENQKKIMPTKIQLQQLYQFGIHATKEHECIEELCKSGFVLNSLLQWFFKIKKPCKGKQIL
jgi:hypothetical protein